MILRNCIFDYKIIKPTVFPIPIICVGNLSMGGSGKTPHIDYLINLLKKRNNLAILSRGYKRKKKGFIYIQESDSANICGDESVLLKQKHPDVVVAVNKNRTSAIKKILIDHPKTDVILLDDGFQHRQVQAGLYILLTEYKNPFFKDYLLPFGSLRENRKAAKRADIIIISKCPNNLENKMKEKILDKIGNKRKRDVYFSKIIYNNWYSLVKTKNNISDFNKYKIILITGIANTYSITNFLKNKHEINHLKYNDHYIYTIKDIYNMLNEYKKEINTKKIILTTEKDAVKLKKFKSYFKNINIYVCPIEININESYNFDKKIINYVKSN